MLPNTIPKNKRGSPNAVLVHFEDSFGPSGRVPGAPAEMVILGFKFDAQKWALARHQKRAKMTPGSQNYFSEHFDGSFGPSGRLFGACAEMVNFMSFACLVNAVKPQYGADLPF